MRYSNKDIPNIPLTEFMAALGEKPAMVNGHSVVYYTPYRDDPEPMFWVNTKTNCWHDYATDESGGLRELASLNMNHNVYKDTSEYILKMMNEFEIGKEMSAMARRSTEPEVISLDIKNSPLTDFLKSIGYEPVKKEGCILTYLSPYNNERKPTLLVDTSKNRWRDIQSGAYGGIYDLAYELTGSCNMSELNRYIAGQMQGFNNDSKSVKAPDLPKAEKVEPPKPRRKMRF